MQEARRFSDEAVLLDRLTLDDVSAHVAGEDDEHARRFGWFPARSNEETARAAILRWEHDWRSGGPTRTFAIRDASTRTLVGGCQVRLREKQMAELSYWVFPQHRRKSYAVRAVRLACRFAFSELAIERIEAYVQPDNVASRRVLERAGFVEEGIARARERTATGDRWDMVLYSLLPADVDDFAGAAERRPAE